MRARLTLLIVLALALIATGNASAARAPRNGEGAAIYAALRAANLTCSRYPAGSCKIGYRVSTVNGRWAAVRIRPTVNGESNVNPQTISLHRVHKKKGRWAVMDTGNGGGCSVPKRPRFDLGLICLEFQG
jgi:hypothetical protein